MSITLMTMAWKTAFQAGRKMVLLALCDNASDEETRSRTNILLLSFERSRGDFREILR